MILDRFCFFHFVVDRLAAAVMTLISIGEYVTGNYFDIRLTTDRADRYIVMKNGIASAGYFFQFFVFDLLFFHYCLPLFFHCFYVYYIGCGSQKKKYIIINKR